MPTNYEPWPPVLPRLPMVQPKWSYRSNVMVWDIDVSSRRRRIAAASSDCNLYILNYDGQRCARFEMASQVDQVRFINDDLVLVNGRMGSIYGLRLMKDGPNAESLVLEFERNFGNAEADSYGCPTSFSIVSQLDKVLIGYGNKNSSEGGIALMDFSGDILWQQTMKSAVMNVVACGQGVCNLKNGPIGFATTLNTKSQFSSYYIDMDGNVKPAVGDASLIGIAGVSSTTGALLIGLTFDKTSYRLIKFSPLGTKEQTIHTDGFPVRALFFDNDTVIVSANTPLQADTDKSVCNVSAWREDTRIWHREMVKQVFQLAFDEENRIVFVSSLGQGNVYALTEDGEPISCAKVELAPLCFRIDKDSKSLFVGSKNITMFSIGDFIQN